MSVTNTTGRCHGRCCTNPVPTTRKWCSDRCRKGQYAGACVDCGAATNGSDGRGKRASTRCAECAHRWAHEHAHWTPAAITDAIQRWVAEHGQPPTAREWKVPNGFPQASTVQKVMGSWNAAIEAAGFDPIPPGNAMGGPWSRERIVERIREWVAEHGQPPTNRGWKKATTSTPCARTVVWHFGSWNAAIAAAGFTPRARGDTRLARP